MTDMLIMKREKEDGNNVAVQTVIRSHYELKGESKNKRERFPSEFVEAKRKKEYMKSVSRKMKSSVQSTRNPLPLANQRLNLP